MISSNRFPRNERQQQRVLPGLLKEEEFNRDDPDHWFVFRNKKKQNNNLGGATHLTFDSSIKVIPIYAVARHTSLVSVQLPNTIQKIGTKAFFDCKLLRQVDFGNGGLQQIFNWAFEGCISLEEVILPSSVVELRTGVFYQCSSLLRVDARNTGIKVIPQNTFMGCTKLREMDLPTNLKRIEYCAFYGCESLLEARIPDSVQFIGATAFCECASLKTVYMSKSLQMIGSLAFADCTSLMGIEFPRNLAADVNIDPEAFVMCRALVNVCLPTRMEQKAASWKCCQSSSAVVALSMDDCFARLRQLCVDNNNQSHIRDRFGNLPIHRLCYHASDTTLDELEHAIQNNASGMETDYLKMTSFHIIATSANPRLDILQALLVHSKYATMLPWKDFKEFTMVDYLIQNPRGIPLLQFVLEWEFGKLSHLQMGVLKGSIDSLAKCQNNLKDCLRQIFTSVGYQMQKEPLTLLELALWKTKMLQGNNNNIDRESCRYQSGAQVVMENVAEYWRSADKDYYYRIALSAFPLLSSSN